MLHQKFGCGAIPPPPPPGFILLLFQTTQRWETSLRPMVCRLAQRQSGFQSVTCPERYRVQGAAGKSGRATLKMLRRKSKAQFLNQERTIAKRNCAFKQFEMNCAATINVQNASFYQNLF